MPINEREISADLSRSLVVDFHPSRDAYHLTTRGPRGGVQSQIIVDAPALRRALALTTGRSTRGGVINGA